MSSPARPFRPACIAVVVLASALLLAACATTPHASVAGVRVLGEGSGNPEVEGQPAPPGAGELDAVSCADVSHCWAVGVGAPSSGSDSLASSVIVATADGGTNWSPEALTMPTTPNL